MSDTAVESNAPAVAAASETPAAPVAAEGEHTAAPVAANSSDTLKVAEGTSSSHDTVSPVLSEPVTVVADSTPAQETASGAGAVASESATSSATFKGHLFKKGEGKLLGGAGFKLRYHVLNFAEQTFSYFDNEAAFTSGKKAVKDSKVSVASYAVIRGEPLPKSLRTASSMRAASASSNTINEAIAAANSPGKKLEQGESFYLQPVQTAGAAGPTRVWEFRTIAGSEQTLDAWIEAFEKCGCVSEAKYNNTATTALPSVAETPAPVSVPPPTIAEVVPEATATEAAPAPAAEPEAPVAAPAAVVVEAAAAPELVPEVKKEETPAAAVEAIAPVVVHEVAAVVAPAPAPVEHTPTVVEAAVEKVVHAVEKQAQAEVKHEVAQAQKDAHKEVAHAKQDAHREVAAEKREAKAEVKAEVHAVKAEASARLKEIAAPAVPEVKGCGCF